MYLIQKGNDFAIASVKWDTFNSIVETKFVSYVLAIYYLDVLIGIYSFWINIFVGSVCWYIDVFITKMKFIRMLLII